MQNFVNQIHNVLSKLSSFLGFFLQIFKVIIKLFHPEKRNNSNFKETHQSSLHHDSLTSHPVNERPIGAVHLIGKYEAQRDNRSQHGRPFSFNGSEGQKKKNVYILHQHRKNFTRPYSNRKKRNKLSFLSVTSRRVILCNNSARGICKYQWMIT